MNAAIVILILAVIALIVATPSFIVKVLYRITEWIIGKVQHELMMRPKERYYRM